MDLIKHNFFFSPKPFFSLWSPLGTIYTILLKGEPQPDAKILGLWSPDNIVFSFLEFSSSLYIYMKLPLQFLLALFMFLMLSLSLKLFQSTVNLLFKKYTTELFCCYQILSHNFYYPPTFHKSWNSKIYWTMIFYSLKFVPSSTNKLGWRNQSKFITEFKEFKN